MTTRPQAEMTFKGRRTCSECGELKELDAFPKRGLQCKQCVKDIQRESEGKRKKSDRRTAFKALVAGIRGNKIEVPHTSEVAAEMIRLYGGLSNFCREWKSDLDSLRTEKPGSKMLLDAKSAIVKLVVESTNQRDSAPDLAGMSDEDLETEFSGLAALLLSKNPDVMRELLEDSGLRLIDGDGNEKLPDGSSE